MSDEDNVFRPYATPSDMFWDAVLAQPDGSISERFMLAAATLWVGPGDLVVELGANHGQHSRLLGERCGSGGRLILVEADPTLADDLRLGAAQSNGRIEVINAAVTTRSDQHGITFFRHTGRDQEGSIYHREAGDVYESVTVPAVTLDELVGDGLKPSFVKIDVEGAEFDVLRGASHFLDNQDPLIACELHRVFPNDPGTPTHLNYTADTFVSHLAAHRWRLYTLDGIKIEAHDWENPAFRMNYQCWIARDESLAEVFVRDFVPELAATFAWGATPSPPYPFHLDKFPVRGSNAWSRDSNVVRRGCATNLRA